MSFSHTRTQTSRSSPSHLTFCPLAALIVNITSLIHLKIYSALLDSDLPVLTNIVQSHRGTLEVLLIGGVCYETLSVLFTDLLEAAGNSQLNRLELYKSDYEMLPPRIHEQYKHLLKKWEFQ